MPVHENCGCPLCGRHDSQPSAYGLGDLRIVRCRQCNLWYLSPRLCLAAMKEHYARADYFEGGDSGYDSYASQETSLRMTFRRLLRNLANNGMCGGSVLDVGCGYGYFLQEASSYFDVRTGTDYSQGALDRALRHADQAFLGGVEDVPEHLQFDCIVALHVVEHVYQPREFVAQLSRRLKPGGTLLLAAPDMGSWWRRAMGCRWPSFKYPEHVAYYDQRTLRRLIETAGFEAAQRIPYPHAFPMNLVMSKLRLPSMASLDGHAMWLPATTVALAARKARAQCRRAAA